MADRSMGNNVRGFRAPAGAPQQQRKQKQNEERRITAKELADNLSEISRVLSRLSKSINDRTVRHESLVKLLVNSGVVNEDAYRSNVQSLKKVQSFIGNTMENPNTDFLTKVKDVVEFNKNQPDDFKITDEYFPVRNYLALNPDDLSLDDIGEIATSFGFPEPEVFRLLAEVKIVEKQKAEQNGD